MTRREGSYEEFLSAFAPARRRAQGVYYTPVEVVRAQVELAADVLEQRLGCPGAYADPRVLSVDPATGSGAYPLAVVANVVARTGQVPKALARRLRLVEPMAGAAGIARSLLAAALGGPVDVEERDALDGAFELQAPIVVCLGNPPYRRHQAAARARALVADFAEPGAGVHAKNLYNDYVYFWRWAARAVFEQRRGPGIVSFVTASSYLRGPGFAGMRRWLRRVLDELWIVDLEGDQLAARTSHNVFPIRTPVAIAMGVRYAATSSPETPAEVHYARLAGSRADKLAALEAMHHVAEVQWQSVSQGWCAPFIARPRSAYASWPKLTELFPFQVSGAQLKRTWPIAPTPAALRARWQRLLELSSAERGAAFRPTRDRDLDSTPADLFQPTARLEPLRGLSRAAPCLEPVPYAYRSFDRQWVLPDARLGDFMRPVLWRSAGPRQIFLTSLLTNVLGPGPAAVATALVPDLDCFRGSFGARAVIPLWRDRAATCPNVAPGVLAWLSAQYRFEVRAEDLLAYCYALLATRGFQARFAEELQTPGPRIPLTTDAALFKQAAGLGQRLLWLHTYGQRAGPVGSVPRGQAACVAPVELVPGHYDYDAARRTLAVGQGSFGPIAPEVWAYSVSGLRVVAAWLSRRVGRPSGKRHSSVLDRVGQATWTEALSQELLELIWVLEATLALEPALDQVLAQAAVAR